MRSQSLQTKRERFKVNRRAKRIQKKYRPDDSFVPITEPITDIKSLLELYGDVGKSRAHVLDSTWDENMPFSYGNYCEFCNVVEERENRKRGIAAVGFSVPNNQKVIELTFLNVVEERYERNERTTGRFGLSVTSDQTVITLLHSLIKP